MRENNKTITKLLLDCEDLDISKYDESFLEKTVEKRMTECHCSSEKMYFDYLQQSHIEAQEYIRSLSVCYSEFFRNPLTFAVLERVVLPGIIYSKKKNKQHEVRIWTAACAAGQETYSIAMLLNEYTNDNEIKFRIFATDQSEEQIEYAQKGVYKLSELSSLSVGRLANWFLTEGDNYFIKPELKEHIEFSTFDLFSKEFSSPPTSIFGDFDLIMCSNLLFYYKPEFQKVILKKVKNCLSNDGFLVTGETEREILMKHHFKEVYQSSAIFKIPNDR
jgi:chemotaxis protein methyltransferase CheR